MVVACTYGLAIFESEKLAVAQNGDTSSEFMELAWGPATGKRGSELYILKDDGTVLRLLPGIPNFDELELPPVRAMTSDEKGQLTYACFDEDDWSLGLHVHRDGGLELTHNLEASAVITDVYLARMGDALAVGFKDDRVFDRSHSPSLRAGQRGACLPVPRPSRQLPSIACVTSTAGRSKGCRRVAKDRPPSLTLRNSERARGA
jgi:hypothetical protein